MNTELKYHNCRYCSFAKKLTTIMNYRKNIQSSVFSLQFNHIANGHHTDRILKVFARIRIFISYHLFDLFISNSWTKKTYHLVRELNVLATHLLCIYESIRGNSTNGIFTTLVRLWYIVRLQILIVMRLGKLPFYAHDKNNIFG